MINSFKYRFILSFVTLEIFFILCIVTINFLALSKSTSQLINSKIDSTSQLMRELVKSPLSVYDLATLDNITQNSNLKNVNSIVILDSQNRVLSKNYTLNKKLEEILSTKKTHKLIENHKKYDISYMEVKNDDALLGSIYIVFDMSQFDDLIYENKINTIFIILIEILLSTIISYIIGHKLTQHLTKLSNTAKELGKSKDLEIEIPYQDDKTELGILAKSLDQMKEDLKHRDKVLKSANDVFENIKEAIIVFNEDGNITLLNDAFFTITHKTKDKLIGQNIFKIDFGIENSKLIEIISHLRENDEWQGEYTLDIKDNNPIIILLNFTKIENVNHTTYILIFSDISKEKEKESILQVQSKMATMGEMIGNIAHQWRQPLSAISSASSGIILQKELGVLTDEFLIKTLRSIIDTTQFLSDTIEDFRGFFKREKESVDFKVSEVVQKIQNIINTLLKNKNINLIIELEDDPIINGYQNELTQALINIINNAKDVLAEKKIENKTIIIKSKIVDEKIVIEIIDNGGGISKKIIHKVFEPYFTTKHQSQGTGIGLYMTHTIITKHFKGSLEVENQTINLKDKKYTGATFKIILPITQAF